MTEWGGFKVYDSGVRIPISKELFEDISIGQEMFRLLGDEITDTLRHGPKQGPHLRDVVPEELRWENSWYWETPHDWEEEDDR